MLSGVLAGESAASLTLALTGGVRLDVLRKDIKSLKSLDVSLMPESLAVALKPSDVANVIAWLRQPPTRQVLFDDSPAFVDLLKEGGGSATVVTERQAQRLGIAAHHTVAAALKEHPRLGVSHPGKSRRG